LFGGKQGRDGIGSGDGRRQIKDSFTAVIGDGLKRIDGDVGMGFQRNGLVANA